MSGVSTQALPSETRWRTTPLAVAPGSGAGSVQDAGSLPILIVLAAVLFNAGLAFINGNITPLSSSAVIGAEVLIVITAHVAILAHYRPQMFPWYVVIVLTVLFALERGIVVGNFDPKLMRDVLLIPTFVLLGMTVSPRRLTPMVVALHIIVVGGVLFEAFFVEAFSRLFEVRDYYIATRAMDDSQFYNTASDLFVSATRPAERFLSFVDFHRVSSVLLEPVSLGNYVVIVTAFLCANFRNMSLKTSAFLIVGNIIALIGCDGRFAAVSSAIVIVVALLAPILPRRSALLYLPLAVLCAAIFVAFAEPNATQDNFPGRVAYSIDLLNKYDLAEWFGNSNHFLGPAMDSGLAYAIATQSIVGVVLFWLFLVLHAKEDTVAQVRYLHSICAYLALSMLVSYSLFSIKTAALLWFIFGSLQATSIFGAVPSQRQPRRARGVSEQPFGAQTVSLTNSWR